VSEVVDAHIIDAGQITDPVPWLAHIAG
jgi:hypothetical protein